MKWSYLSIAIVFVSICYTSCGQDLPEAKITAQIVDENDSPIQGARIGAWFPQAYGAGSSAKGQNVVAFTDINGFATLKATTAGSVGFGAQKEGYYKSVSEMFDFIKMVHLREEPFVHRKLMMKKIKDPIPLYARKLRHLLIPDFNAPFGFDLEIGDWVAPHGKGKTVDIIFQISGTYKSYREHDLRLEVSFPNEGDGLIEFEGAYQVGSALRSDHLAPESGYKPNFVLRKKSLYDQKSSQRLNESKPGANYYLRTRTKLDEDGNVVRANYGKIYGKIYGNLDFLDYIKAEAYYFNPKVNDRNVEFDTKRNLAEPAKSFEQVRMP